MDNPVWTDPDGFLWIEMMSDEQKIGLHIGLMSTWNESAYFADFILPMGIGSERHNSHSYETHLERWKLEHTGQNQLIVTVSLDQNGNQWDLQRKKSVHDTVSQDADRVRVWWTDGGVQTFPVHPDPISGMHCWHQARRLTGAKSSDRYGDIHVDTEKSHAAYTKWLRMTRPADQVSPDGSHRPNWLLRPLKPGRNVYQLPATERIYKAHKD